MAEHVTAGEIERARAAGAAGPVALSARYDEADGRVWVELEGGLVFGFPAESAQGLRGASARALGRVEVLPGGTALHWEELDAGFTVAGLLGGVFGTRTWMEGLRSEAAAALGAAGGRSTSEAKARAARENGRKGGRPRGTGSRAAGAVYGTRGRAALSVREEKAGYGPGEPPPANAETGGAAERDEA